MKYQAVKGMADIFGDEARRYSALESLARAVGSRYGYEEIRTPLVEPTELFVRSIGEATDIVEKEMFSFEDKGGDKVTMRPEATAQVVRAFVEHGMVNRLKPVKLWYIGPMFRYERPQAGRYRQYHSFGLAAYSISKYLM